VKQVDLLFCLDASQTMENTLNMCVEGLTHFDLSELDVQYGFLAHNVRELTGLCNQHIFQAIYHKTLVGRLFSFFGKTESDSFFSNRETLINAMENVNFQADEANLLALDVALDYQWRRGHVFRFILQMTDEAFDTGFIVEQERARIEELNKKIRETGIFVCLIAPDCQEYRSLFQDIPDDLYFWHKIPKSDKGGFEKVNMNDIFQEVKIFISEAVERGENPPKKIIQRPLFTQRSQKNWNYLIASLCDVL